jgi:hypothetical protein
MYVYMFRELTVSAKDDYKNCFRRASKDLNFSE